MSGEESSSEVRRRRVYVSLLGDIRTSGHSGGRRHGRRCLWLGRMDAREHRPQLPTSCAYQPPSTAGVRLAAARVLGRAVAGLMIMSLDTAQLSARAKRGPELACRERELASLHRCPGRRIHSAHNRALVTVHPCKCRSARLSMPPLRAISEVTLPCAGHARSCPRGCC